MSRVEDVCCRRYDAQADVADTERLFILVQSIPSVAHVDGYSDKASDCTREGSTIFRTGCSIKKLSTNKDTFVGR